MSRSAKGFCHGLLGAREHLTDPYALPALPRCVPVDAVAIAERGYTVIRGGVHDLLNKSNTGHGEPGRHRRSRGPSGPSSRLSWIKRRIEL
jgi:hypothetical protein